MYKQMKTQTKRLFLGEVVPDKLVDSKQFKTISGSPILYTKLRKRTGLYYPFAKHKVTKRQKPQKSHRPSAVVNSRSYGREVFENVDIWSDSDSSKDKLLDNLKGLPSSDEEDAGDESPVGLLHFEDDFIYHG